MRPVPSPSAWRQYSSWLVCLFCLIFILLFGIAASGQNPVPFVNQPLVPDAVAPGAAAFTLTVNGTGFVKGSVVSWNGAPLATTFVSSSQLTAIVPAVNVATNTTVSITVSSPAPGGGISNVEFFVVSSPVSTLTFTPLVWLSAYFPSVPYPPGAFPLITADFNGDGILDIAGLGTSNNVIVQLGNGDGTFQAPQTYSVGSGPINMIAADFNGDGKLDLAITTSAGISVLLGNGDGTFQPPTTVSTVPGGTAILAADFNGDGKLDLATTNGTLLGNGDGTFEPLVAYGSGGCVYLAAGDFNQDGKLDLVCGDPLGVSFLQGNGDGTFQPPVTIPGPPSETAISSLSSADLDGDGKLDLIAGLSAEGQGQDVPPPYPPSGALVWLGNGDGTFQSPVDYGGWGGNLAPTYGLAMADFNADGITDVALTGSDSAASGQRFPGYCDVFQILLGNGGGAFQGAQVSSPWQSSLPAPIPPYCGGILPVVAGDFNGDGKMDLILGSSIGLVGANTQAVAVLLQGQVPVAILYPSNPAFGQQAVGTTSQPQTINLTDAGTASLTVTSIGITGPDAGDFAQANNCGSTLAASATCGINVTFTPAAGGTRAASLSFAYSAIRTPLTISLTGTGLAPEAVFSPTSLTFPGQFVGTTGLPQNITLSNNGDAALTITSIKTTAQFQATNGCTSSLAAGVNCTISVFFDPTSAGTQTGTLTITDNAPESPQTVALSGAGQDFGMSASSSSATISAGQTANYSLSVAPEGGLAQTVSLTCSGTPQLSTCTLTPSTVTLNGSASVPVAVAVSTTAATMVPPLGKFFPPAVPGGWVLWSIFLLVFVCLAVLSATGRRRALWLPGICLLMMIVWASCGGGSVTHNPGTPAGTYTLKVTGTVTSSGSSTQLTHTANLTLTVD